MRNDPFAELTGLDQKLFSASPKAAEDGVAVGLRTAKKEERPSGLSDVGTKEQTSLRKKKGTFERPVQRTEERPTDRRPYDFYRDQILWLNRTKVEIQEKYGRRVSANAMVQFAVDLLMRDYKRRKERSKLVTKLVINEPTEERPSGRT